MIDPLQKMLTDLHGDATSPMSWGDSTSTSPTGWPWTTVRAGTTIDALGQGRRIHDLVSFTRLSQKMEPRQLANMVQEFQGMAYNIVATGGGRVIKTVGDEVFFAASTWLAEPRSR